MDMATNIAQETHVSPARYPQMCLLGDSLTQRGVLHLQAFLQNAYIRRLDVINRGFNGYTAPLGLRMLRTFLPELQPVYISQPPVKLMTVFFGANDSTILPTDPAALAALPPNEIAQSVPLPEFTAALRDIINHPPLVSQNTRIILLTPPPCDEYLLAASYDLHNRTAENTKAYADAVRSVAREMRHRNIVVCDVWTAFMETAGWGAGEELLPGSRKTEKNRVLAELLSDGVHLTEAGYKVVRLELMRVIERECPECMPERLPFVLKMDEPGWEWEDP